MSTTKAFNKLAAFLVAAFLVFSSANIFAQEKTIDETQQDPARTQQDPGVIQQEDQNMQENESDDQFRASAEELTESLSAQVTLRDDQKSDIQDAIVEYQQAVVTNKGNETDVTGENQNQDVTGQQAAEMEQWLNDEIESILDESQKAQWQVAKADFLNQLRDKVATLKSNTEKDRMY